MPFMTWQDWQTERLVQVEQTDEQRTHVLFDIYGYYPELQTVLQVVVPICR